VRILVADDDSTSLRLLEFTLAKWGYEVVPARDGAEAWQGLQRDDAPPLVILDWMMPGMDGIEICRRVRAEPMPRLIHIILLTSKDRREDVVAGLEAGADDYVVKPFDPAELRARVGVGARIVELQRGLAERGEELAVARVLAVEQELVEAAVTAMSDGIVVTDADWRITTTNRAACLLLNLPPDGWKSLPIEDALHPFTLSVPWADLQAAGPHVAAVEITRPDTQPPLFLDARLTHIVDPAGKLAGAVLTVRDVTAERHDENIRANFFTTVSHKLRTPLTVLGGFLYLLKRLPPERLVQRSAELLAMCASAVQRLQGLVDQLLDLKAIGTRQMESESPPADVASVIAAACGKVRGLYATRPIEIETEIAPDAARSAASPEHVGIVLGNLLENAVKFADKTPVRIRVQVQRKDPSWLAFSVSDNGPGIPHEYYDRIFEGFVQVEDRVSGQVPGLGVGLLMARQIIHAYRGTISVQSRIGEGSTFSFTLPAAPDEGRPAGPMTNDE
jgi:signal transduction histidine kinase